MISDKELDLVEDLLVDELKKTVKKGELKDGNEAKAVKDVLEGIKAIYCIRDGNNTDSGYSGAPNWNHMPNRRAMEFSGTYGGVTPMPHGYSGHSIHDRMIAQLEKLYDTAGSQYEKDLIKKEINHIREN